VYGIFNDSERLDAVLPLCIIEKRIVLDSASANASITFWVISYFFNCGRVILCFNMIRFNNYVYRYIAIPHSNNIE